MISSGIKKGVKLFCGEIIIVTHTYNYYVNPFPEAYKDPGKGMDDEI